MGDPWKSITPKGVQAYVNASIATVIVWLTVENHISILIEQLSAFLSSQNHCATCILSGCNYSFI
jgi:hypothetical protein